MTDQPAGKANVYYGGQAVLEGVMIRGPEHMAVAIRHPKGHIVRHSEKLNSVYTGKARSMPLLRGIIVLAETMTLGMRALSFSTKIALDEEEEDGTTHEFPQTVFWGTMLLSLLFVVGFFFATPILIAHLLENFDAPRWVIVGTEGIIRLLMFILYIAAISFIPDIRRVFQYHGAEHMTIHAYEAGNPLTVEAIRPFPKEHQRCGTSFLLVVVFVALITFFVFDLLVDEGLIIRIASRTVLVPFVAALSYEILRLGARYNRYGFVRALFMPNILLQGLTTKVPDDSQIEVAIASFETTLEAANMLEPKPESSLQPV